MSKTESCAVASEIPGILVLIEPSLNRKAYYNERPIGTFIAESVNGL